MFLIRHRRKLQQNYGYVHKWCHRSYTYLKKLVQRIVKLVFLACNYEMFLISRGFSIKTANNNKTLPVLKLQMILITYRYCITAHRDKESPKIWKPRWIYKKKICTLDLTTYIFLIFVNKPGLCILIFEFDNISIKSWMRRESNSRPLNRETI